ncbi:response regulator [Paenibacillus eucommiae]|uniref:Two-component system response regulator YesN n=1 Tax=Paenibacillus eucommiae TaxID=1355755 RepID=A0ABS4J816_9BACL|nr:response regulator [Paenibacillus eucommiae]MBP1995997.1 two-component system response regulator YesN [Paenibacillus eucommiae]
MKVLIVEDEHLVRKGLISMMPWADFGLEVAAEAANGVEAIPLIKEHGIELLITDLAMPKMSGLDLMRHVRVHFPHVWMVVLTFHQDFEHIQTALRLGAIDYIAKVQLEKEQMDEVLRRITARIQQVKADSAYNSSEPSPPQTGLQHDKAYVFLALTKGQGSPGESCLKEMQAAWTEVETNLWFCPVGDECQERSFLNKWAQEAADGQGVVLNLSGLLGLEKSSLLPSLREYVSRRFFYDYAKGQSLYELSYSELSKLISTNHALNSLQGEVDITSIREQWASLYWVNDEQRFHEYVAQMEQLLLPAPKLESLFYTAMTRWERFTEIPSVLKEGMDGLRFWSDWLDWLHAVRMHIRTNTMKARYAKDIVESIMRATERIHDDLSCDIKLKDVARAVGMSPSYMSACFHDIVGKPFQDYVRDARIVYAQTLLRETNKPIYWIAVQTGYPNEKYFSKMFREQTGKLPSEYRQGP